MSDKCPTSDGGCQSCVACWCSACGSCLCNVLICIVILIAASVALSIAFLGSPNPAEFLQQDPPSKAQNETERWRTSGNNGLELTVENALNDDWIPYFEEYIQRWDESTPDALTLTPVRVAVDNECEGTPGRLKVCNGDYGETDWKGINLNLIQNGFIVQGTCKLNDRFLVDDDEKRYTMCHEMGHGFGLAHSDTNYYNVNMGNCLDYTLIVSTNLDPGTFNYEILAELYGTVPPVRRLEEAVPSHIAEKYRESVVKMESSAYECVENLCTENLGDGYSLVSHKLLIDG